MHHVSKTFRACFLNMSLQHHMPCFFFLFFQLILFLSVLISILQNFIIYFQLHSPKLLYFLPIIASFWEIIKCVGIIILLSFFLSLQQLHCPFHRSFRAHMHLQFPLTDAGKSFLQHRQIPRGSSLGQNGA